MASGGYQPTKQGRSESKRQTNWQRSFSSDRDDAHSLNSLPGDMRINNWDLSDLHPSNLGGNSKRHKKSKGNPEREREQSLSMDSPPNEKKHHTPSSFPRTKITANTPTSQRVALENIKLHMTFSDMEDDQANVDAERNNERLVRHKQRSLPNGSLNRAHSDDSIRATSMELLNRNNNMHRSSKEQGPDRNEIVARLTQIREFMKQAKSMLDSLERLGNRKRTEDVEKVRRLIRNLQEQEQGYTGLLQNSMKTPQDEADDDEEDEAAGDEEEEDDDDDDNDKILEIEAMECSDENSSGDQFVETEMNEASQESRPRIESKLGIDSDGSGRDHLEEMFLGAGRESMEDVNHSGLAEADQATVLHSGVPVQESQEGARGPTEVDGEVMSDARKDLLQILREKEQQLQSLMSRQQELNVLRQEATKKLMEVKARDNIASTSLAALISNQQFIGSRPQPMEALEMVIRGAAEMRVNDDEEGSRGAAGLDKQLKSNIVEYQESDEEDNSKVQGVEALPNKLLELKRQLTYLKNEFSQISEDPNNMETDTRALAEGPQQLQNKLHELQNKKLQLDMRLQELQLIHSPPSDNSKNNETNAQASSIHSLGPAVPHFPATQQQQHHHHQQQTSHKPPLSRGSSALNQPINLQEQEDALASFADLAAWSDFGQESEAAMMPGMMQELQEKLRCLKEVRVQLNQLKSSVQLNETEQSDLEAEACGVDRRPLVRREHGGDANLHTSVAAPSSNSSFQLQKKEQLLKQHPQQRTKQRPQQKQQQQKQQLQQKPQPKQQQQQLKQHQVQPKQHQVQPKQHQSQPKQLKPPVNRYPQQPNEMAATASPRNVTQLLNLEGTDPGDEHSDEDNVSPSKAGSVWSVMDSWDHDPTVQEKVRKLKSAKENLRQLQDLVAFVQQTPDGVGGLSEEQAGKAASGDVSHTAQTYDLNVSVSEEELPSESLRIPQRDDGAGEMEDPLIELENLRRERSLLVDLQNQLQRIQSQTSGPSAGEVRVRSRPDSDRQKSGLEPASSTPVVTFASNDELYSKIRRQRILHEELRSKKRELEAIMKKDQNRRQYSRNQDNHSDSVSLTTDTFGAAASFDATMATWGGSTADNLENITEDEDGQDRESSNHREEDHENEDDGNPSRNRSSSRNVQHLSNLNSRKQTQRRSLKEQQDDDDEDDDNDFRGPNVDWYRNIESRLSGLGTAVETLLKKSDNEGRQLHVSVGHENMSHSSTGPLRQDQHQLLQLQNQSLMLSFSQLVQTLTRQQGDIQHLQQVVQALQLQIQAVSFEQMTPAVTVNLPSPFLQAQPSPVVSTCSSRPRTAAAAMGVRPVIIKHQQKPHLHSQRNVNNTDLFDNHSATSSTFPSLQAASLSISARHLPQGADKTPADGACSNLEASRPTQQGQATRKSGTNVKKSYSDSISGVRMSAARSENLGEDRSRAYPVKTNGGRAASRAPAVGKASARMDDFDQDGSGYCSSQSVSSQCSGLQSAQVPVRPGDSGAAVTNSSTLFDTLRDTIYTEVASLISQNENRPYFLLELFRDMQRVDSDSMRQQALNSLQELVHSGHRNVMSGWSSMPAWTQSTQTQGEIFNTGLIPSKNLTSEEEEDDDGDLSDTPIQEEIPTERSRLERVIRSSTYQSAHFDYAELVDNPSSLSTPTNCEDESLTHQRYQPTQEKSRRARTTHNSTENTEKRASTSESMKQEHVDTKQWEHQVRSIMMAITTFVKEHMGDLCSAELLNYIIRLVVSSVTVSGGQDFVRLFQQKLTAVLEDLLVKYQGRRMRECGAELIINICNVLHQQLADLGLVHNFDDRVVTGQGKSRDPPVQVAKSDKTPEQTTVSRTPAKVDNINKYANANEYLEDKSLATGFRAIQSEQAALIGLKVASTQKSESEHDDDDAGESEQSFCDAGVSDQSYTVELAQSETKPFTRIGSDEDDDEGDQVWSINDPSETAVSRDARLENGAPHHTLVSPPPTRPEAEGAREDGAEKQNLGQSMSPRPTYSSRGDKVDGSSGGVSTVADISQVNGSTTDQTCNNEEQTQASSCEKLVLPTALPDSATHSDPVSAPSSGELKGRYLEEQTTLNGLDAVLASLGGMEELAGDETSVLGPDTFLN